MEKSFHRDIIDIPVKRPYIRSLSRQLTKIEYGYQT